MPVEASDVGEDDFASIPRGGPIYVENMVGPLTTVPDFELSVFTQLQNLKAEVGWDSTEPCDDDLSVDELKIIKEEDLVNKVFEDVFEDEKLASQGSDQLNQREVSSEKNSVEIVEGRDTSVSEVCLDGASVGGKKRQSDAKISRGTKKRRRVSQRNCLLEERYVAKVEELARIKQKQEDDKSAARLHSFNGSSSVKECSTGSSDKNDRMMALRSTRSSAKVRFSSFHEHIPTHFPEVMLSLEVYHSRKTWLKTQEFLVLGRQFLTEVRDKICCLIDDIMQKAGQYDLSGYFLIEDVFCNDLRQSSAIDYSKPILEWLEHSKKDALRKWECIASGKLQQKQKEVLDNRTELQLPRLKSVDMQKTRFCDLKFRLGAAYLYCHQGDCKHAIVIRDMRLIHPEDVHNRAAYPLVTFQVKMRVQKCSACKIFRATKVTVDDKWAGENPCYFCDLCYYMLHYVNGHLLYDDFSVYDYFHD